MEEWLGRDSIVKKLSCGGTQWLKKDGQLWERWLNGPSSNYSVELCYFRWRAQPQLLAHVIVWWMNALGMWVSVELMAWDFCCGVTGLLNKLPKGCWVWIGHDWIPTCFSCCGTPFVLFGGFVCCASKVELKVTLPSWRMCWVRGLRQAEIESRPTPVTTLEQGVPEDPLKLSLRQQWIPK